MSGFFSLGSGSGFKDQQQQQQQHEQEQTPSNGLFLFKNEEIYNKGFELWQQYYQQLNNQQRTTHHRDADPENRRIVIGSNNSTSSANLCDESSSYRLGVGVMRQGGTAGTATGGGINCQDCGNQAKKDCTHLRCRTCCKSRGFHCQTHVKSTWVPAAKRRERQQQLASLQQQQQQQNHQLTLMRGENPKRHRENPALPCTRLPTNMSGTYSSEIPTNY